MRKLLLGSTAVAAAALFAPVASAQTPAVSNVIIGPGAGNAWSQFGDINRPPAGGTIGALGALEVRVGGYFRGYYGYARQNLSRGPAAGTPNAGTATAGVRTGSSDFLQETEIHIVVNGKAANGLRYGVALEIENDSIVQVGATSAAGVSTINATTGSSANKNTLALDEAWGFVQGPFGQIRFGDEDPALALMTTGHITNFATGGTDGDFYDVLIGPARVALGMPSDNGDNTKIIYMSPQFFGFDFGASFAFNQGESDREGCFDFNNQCDRLSATAGGLARRRNELTGVARWRGSFGPVGAAAHVGYIGADGVKNSTNSPFANSPQRFNVFEVGAQATAFGFTVGARAFRGNANITALGLQPLFPDRTGDRRDDRDGTMWSVSGSYTIDALTVGAQYSRAVSAGNQSVLTTARQDQVLSVGLTYRIAPGLQAVAEYNWIRRKENGFNFLSGATGSGDNNRVRADVVLAGLQFAF